MARRLRWAPALSVRSWVVLVILALLWLLNGQNEWDVGEQVDDRPGEWRTVERVVDGDTLLLDRRERVRLIGVDTPESVHPHRPVEHFGPEAAAFTRDLVEDERVRLVVGRERQDKYGRTLGFVYLGDGRLLNEEIIREGYGHAYTRHPFASHLMARFRRAEREARTAGRGLWAR